MATKNQADQLWSDNARVLKGLPALDTGPAVTVDNDDTGQIVVFLLPDGCRLARDVRAWWVRCVVTLCG